MRVNTKFPFIVQKYVLKTGERIRKTKILRNSSPIIFILSTTRYYKNNSITIKYGLSFKHVSKPTLPFTMYRRIIKI